METSGGPRRGFPSGSSHANPHWFGSTNPHWVPQVRSHGHPMVGNQTASAPVAGSRARVARPEDGLRGGGDRWEAAVSLHSAES